MLKKYIAAVTLAALSAGLVPTASAMADGAASTRNLLLLGGAAATYLIIQHNKQVHQREADMARQQAAAQESANNAWAAYSSAEHAYQNEAALAGDLKREVAYQHSVIVQQQRLLASAGMHPTYVAQKSTHTARVAVSNKPISSRQVAVNGQGWGWGTI